MTRSLRNRRGSALILVLLMTLAVAALAVAAIFMSSSAGLLSRFYDRERQFAYAAQSALERVVSRLESDTGFTVTSTAPISALALTTVSDAAGAAISGANVTVWAARTGDTTSTGPITISLLAQVSDPTGTRYVRRLDLRRLHFGQWSFITNTATSSTVQPFHGNSFVAGRVHANGNWSTITQATYRDSVTSTGTFGVTNANNLKTGRGESQLLIPWPNWTTLLTELETAAAADTLAFDVSTTNPARAEFVWRDVDADGVADRNEGFVRIYEVENSAYDEELEARATTMTSGNGGVSYIDWDDDVVQNQCGAFYLRNGVWQFFPVATHRVAWAWAIIDSAGGTPAPPSSGNSDNATAVRNILSRPTARCFPSGSPYLVNTERFTDAGGTVGRGSSYQFPFGQVMTSHRYGGQDSTITFDVQQCDIRADGTRCNGGTTYDVGSWRRPSTTPGVETLYPLDDAGRGVVVHFDADITVSGTVAGRVTLASDDDVRIIDALTLAGGPNVTAGACAHLLGIIAYGYVRIEQNLINHRTRVGSSVASSTNVMLGGRDHTILHAGVLSLTDYFGLEGSGFRQGNSNVNTCDGTNINAGCIRHVGSAAMQTVVVFTTGNVANGGRYTLTPDACFEAGYRPPFYPATNRYVSLRAVDVRPAAIIGVNGVANYFASLQGTSDIP